MTDHSSNPECTILEGDCLEEMRGLETGSFDLVYLDPPYCTGKVHRGAESSFDDRWDTLDAYLEFMTARLTEIHRLLGDKGSILLHCDWRTSHRLRVILDEIFGPERFVNHLIWQYGLGGSSPRTFARKHDDILFYARGPEWWFEAPRVPATSNRMAGMTKKATDVLDVPALNNMAKERNGWPTQKPLALLEMLIKACCPPSGRVLDPFCGSGTTLIAALNTGRNAMGIDRNPDAVRLSRERADARSVPLRG